MRRQVIVLASLLLFPCSSRGDDRIIDWVKVTDRAGWRWRDSSGEVAYKDRLWIFGGWFDSFSAPPRDVWSSPDGRAWSRRWGVVEGRLGVGVFVRSRPFALR